LIQPNDVSSPIVTSTQRSCSLAPIPACRPPLPVIVVGADAPLLEGFGCSGLDGGASIVTGGNDFGSSARAKPDAVETIIAATIRSLPANNAIAHFPRRTCMTKVFSLVFSAARSTRPTTPPPRHLRPQPVPPKVATGTPPVAQRNFDRAQRLFIDRRSDCKTENPAGAFIGK
jgi:hypothetical protein